MIVCVCMWGGGGGGQIFNWIENSPLGKKCSKHGVFFKCNKNGRESEKLIDTILLRKKNMKQFLINLFSNCVVYCFETRNHIIYTSEGSKSFTNYLGDKNRFDVSSKGPSSGINHTNSRRRAFARNVESAFIA